MPIDNALFHGDLVNAQRIIYTPSTFAKLSLFHLQEIGQLHAQKPHISSREKLDSYLFFIVQSGSGSLEYNRKKYLLKAGDCVFIDCRSPYSHCSSADLWQLSWVHFNGPSAAPVYLKYLERGGSPVFHPSKVDSYVTEVANLYKIASSDSHVRDMQINEGISTLLTLLMSDSWHPESNRQAVKKTNLSEIRDYLDQNYAKKISLDELAERFFINKYYLTRIFKDQFGITINNYLISLRITHAKQALRFTDKTAEEIAAENGFGTGYYLSRIFTKVEGISPSEYRRQWRG